MDFETIDIEPLPFFQVLELKKGIDSKSVEVPQGCTRMRFYAPKPTGGLKKVRVVVYGENTQRLYLDGETFDSPVFPGPLVLRYAGGDYDTLTYVIHFFCDDNAVKITNSPIEVVVVGSTPDISNNAVEVLLESQTRVVSGEYQMSKVARHLDEDGKIRYSVNYAHADLTFDKASLQSHKPTLVSMCPQALFLYDVNLVELQIEGKMIVKLQAIYELRGAMAEMEFDALINTAEKPNKLWNAICSKCALVGKSMRGARLYIRRVSSGCCCPSSLEVSDQYRMVDFIPVIESLLPNTTYFVACGFCSDIAFEFITTHGKTKVYRNCFHMSTMDALEILGVRALPESTTASAAAQEISEGNVVLTETQATSFDKASIDFEPVWHALASSEQQAQYSNLTTRFIPYSKFVWSANNMPEGFVLANHLLPLDFLNSDGKKYCETVNFVPFNVHAYWRGDLEIKVHLNSNMFQSGQLIVSWLYAADEYAKSASLGQARWSSVASLVQRPHCMVSAGASNEATLYIPYRHVKPYMRTKNVFKGTTYEQKALALGRLVVAVLVPLGVGSTASSPQECSGVIFCRYLKSNFTGMFNGAIAKPEMSFGNILKNTVGVVDKIIGDLNCDNPPLTAPARNFVPINSHNWSHGTRTGEVINTLRLTGGPIGVGRSADIGYSDTAISQIVPVYGLLKPIKWSYSDKKQNIYGKLIWGMGAHPQCDKERMYATSSTEGALTRYNIPPVGVISSLFCYWRGSLNFKFEVVATSKHTGRILVAYVPGVEKYNDITLEQARSSPYVEFSLSDTTSSFVFNVPYVAETFWWPRKYGGPQRAADFVAPSSVVMFVLNPLVPMESVAQYVTILPYVAAGPDFEVSIPAQPAIGLGLNAKNAVPSQDIIEFKQGYYPVYLGSWRNFGNSIKVIFRYSNVSDHVAQLTHELEPPRYGVYIYIPQSISNTPYETNIVQRANSGLEYVDADTKCSTYVGNNANYTGLLSCVVAWTESGYVYGIPVIANNAGRPDDADCRKRAGIIAMHIRRNTLSKVLGLCNSYTVDSDWLNNRKNITFKGIVFDNCVTAKPEMDFERTITKDVLQPVAPLPTTRNGVVTFGESFNDLKDMCRRYQLYWEGTITPGQMRSLSRNAAMLQLPILPQGMNLKPDLQNQVWNNMREGHIPIIASGFRFFRGGVRLRIVVTGLNDSVWVQHHPDRKYQSPEPRVGKDIYDKDAYRNHGYGFHVQNMSVNRTIEVEIPFYKPGLYGLLGDIGQTYDGQEYGTLGDLVIGIEGDQNVSTPVDIAVYYSLADDCSFNVFAGFPDMVFCDDVYKPIYTVAKPEMWGMSSFLTSSVGSVVGGFVGRKVLEGSRAITQPIANIVKEEVAESMTPVMKDIEAEVKKAGETISRTLGTVIPQQAIIGALGQFSQVALNPTAASLAVAVCSMLANFVTVSFEIIMAMQTTLTSFLKSVWERYFAPPSELQGGGVRANPEGFFDEMQDKEVHGFLGMVFSAVASTVGYSIAAPREYPNVMKGIRENLNVCNAAVTFFRNIIDAVKYMYAYAFGCGSEEMRAKVIIEREYPHMKAWCEEVIELLDPRNANVILHSTKQANRVFDACMYGAKLLVAGLDAKNPSSKLVHDLYNKICKLRDDLVELGNHPDVRFEAFPIWVCGPPGVGKSYMTQKVCEDLLRSINYQTSECMIYWLALGQKYWNGIKNPPVIARDEAYAVGGQFTEEEIATHLAICSSSILNPPMAAIQEKNKRLNPLIYYMNSNMEFPQINEARHPEAIYRRRKLLVKVDYRPEIKEAYPDILDAAELSEDLKRNGAHLCFYIARDPKDVNTTYAGPYDYDSFIRIAREKFSAHVDAERRNFKQRMQAAYALDPTYSPEDNLSYVRPGGLPVETLHEVFLREKALARNVLFVPPPTISEEEDPWMSNVLNRFKHLWSDSSAATPEMGFYTETSTSNAEYIQKRTMMDRGAIMKLVSGGLLYEEDVVEGYVIEPWFDKLVKERKVEAAFGLCSDVTSMLPESWSAWYKRVSWNDRTAAIKRGYGDMTLPHWTECTGVDCIRSYNYWLMRQYQLKTFSRALVELTSSEEKHTLMCTFKEYFIANGQLKIWEKVEQISCSQDMVSVMEILEQINIAELDAKKNGELFCLVMFMNALYLEKKEEFCEHCAFWVTHLKDTKNLEFCGRTKKLLYTNSLGFRSSFDGYCECKTAIAKNKLFLNSMRVIWNHDHGTASHPTTNPFSMEEFRQTEVETKTVLERVWEWAKEWWRSVAVPWVSGVLTFLYENIGAILGGLLAMYGLYTWYQSARAPDIPTVINASTVGTTVVALLEKAMGEGGVYENDKAHPAKAHPAPAAKEGGYYQPLDIIENKILNNTLFLECRYKKSDGNIGSCVGRCLALRERKVLVIKHYLEEMLGHPEDSTFMMTYKLNGRDATVFLHREALMNVHWFTVRNEPNTSNIGVLTLPTYVPMFKDILSSIAKRSEHTYVSNAVHSFAAMYEGGVHRRRSMNIRARTHLKIDASKLTSEIRNIVVYEYDSHGAGMCGTTLVSENTCKGNPGIFAVHVAGLKGVGYAEPIFREMFEDPLVVPKKQYIAPQLSPLPEGMDTLDSNLLLLGLVSEKNAHRESGKSRIVPSLIHGQVYPVLTEPNPLKPGDPRQPPGSHPLRDGCNKHGEGYSKPFKLENMARVSARMRNRLCSIVKNPLCVYRELTLQEAICGSVSIPHCESLNWNSSEGYPLCVSRPSQESGKKYLFDLEMNKEGYVLKGMNETLTKILNVRDTMRKKSVVVNPIYIDCLKDYRLTPEKCAIPGKTRIFSIAPVQVTIDVRRYLGLFLSGYKSKCVDAWHGIGIDPDSLQWTKLANYLLEVGNNIVTGDYKNYGPSLSSQLVSYVIEDFLYWLRMNGASEEILMHAEYILENEILNPVHLCEDLVYQTVNGIASGSPITAEVNSEVNIYYLLNAFLILIEKLTLPYTLKDFDKHVRVVTYGDDFIMSVSDEIINWYNCETISVVLRAHGIVLTDAAKGEQITPYRTLEQSNFLKRGFKKHPWRVGVYLAPLEEKSITECLNWCHKQSDMQAGTEEVIKASIQLAFGRGPEYYESHCKRIQRACIATNLQINYETWSDLDKAKFG